MSHKTTTRWPKYKFFFFEFHVYRHFRTENNVECSLSVIMLHRELHKIVNFLEVSTKKLAL